MSTIEGFHCITSFSTLLAHAQVSGDGKLIACKFYNAIQILLSWELHFLPTNPLHVAIGSAGSAYINFERVMSTLNTCAVEPFYCGHLGDLEVSSVER